MEEGFQQDHDAGHEYNGFKVLFFVFISHHTSSIVKQPGKEPFHFPSAFVSSSLSAVLGFLLLPIAFVRGNQFNALLC